MNGGPLSLRVCSAGQNKTSPSPDSTNRSHRRRQLVGPFLFQASVFCESVLKKPAPPLPETPAVRYMDQAAMFGPALPAPDPALLVPPAPTSALPAATGAFCCFLRWVDGEQCGGVSGGLWVGALLSAVAFFCCSFFFLLLEGRGGLAGRGTGRAERGMEVLSSSRADTESCQPSLDQGRPCS